MTPPQLWTVQQFTTVAGHPWYALQQHSDGGVLWQYTGYRHEIDALAEETPMPAEFTVPGENQLSAALDVARTVVRRAERVAVTYPLEDSFVNRYLNRLSDLVWAMARWAEGPTHRTARNH